MASTGRTTEFGLTDEQVQQYHRDGFLGPLDVFGEDEARTFWEGIQEEVLERDRPDHDPLSDTEYPPRTDRHRDSRTLYEMMSDDRIVDKLASIYGEDLFLWFTNVWDKPGNSPPIKWHQEINSLDIYPEICGLAWVSLGEATEENGCMKFVPGSHYGKVPHVPVPEDEQFVLTEEADASAFDESEAVSVETDPGDVILFSANTLHGSWPNQSSKTRPAANMAVLPPNVSFDWSNDRFLPELEPMLVSGENSYPFHEPRSPPSPE